MIFTDTIVASATPIGAPTALSVIRISGPLSKDILSHITTKKIDKILPRKAYFLKLKDEDNFIDEAVVIFFEAPHSFTGEDTVEFYLHGSPYIAQNLISVALKYGARLAEKGEFSLKAVINGKMNIVDAERINALIHAPTKKANLKANEENNELKKFLEEIENDINYLYAYFLQILDYPEEYTDEEEKACIMLDKLIEKVIELRKATSANNYLFNGVKVVIIGQPNVGKSTLLNNILGEEKAIVTSIEGTTRDIVEGQKIYNGILYNFFDTAGIHETEELIEKIGIDKSIKAIEKADIILLLSDSGNFENQFNSFLKEQLDEKKVIRVMTKGDLGHKDWKEADLVISKDDESFNNLFSKIEEKLQIKNYEEPGLFSTRDLDLIDKLLDLLLKIKDDFKEEHSYDLMTIAMQESYHLIKLLSGKEYNPDDIYDQVFSSFCVGK